MAAADLITATVAVVEAEAPVVVAAPGADVEAEVAADGKAPRVAGGRTKGKGKAKGKAKCRGKAGKASKAGKAKAKGKAKSRRASKVSAQQPAKGEADCAPAARAKGGLKGQLLEALAGRDVDEAIAEVRQELEACRTALLEAESSVDNYDGEIDVAKQGMEDASAAVEAAKVQEAAALEKLKVAKLSKGTAAVATRQVESEIAECMKVMRILELELASEDRVRELEKAKQAAFEAAEAARKALEESKLKEKEAQDAWKASLAKQREEELRVLKDGTGDKVSAEARREQRLAERLALKEAAAEVAQLERARTQREKERQRSWREALVVPRGRQPKALMNGSPEDEQPAAKAARAVEIV